MEWQPDIPLFWVKYQHIIGNVYAPTDHNENYFNQLKDIILDIQTGNPTYSVIILVDFNITLEDRDSDNRNMTQQELTARGIMKEIMHEINLKDCYRGIISAVVFIKALSWGLWHFFPSVPIRI